MAQNEACKAVCNTTFDIPSSRVVNSMIWEEYNVNWFIDGLPAAQANKTGFSSYSPGFLLGTYGDDDYPLLNNHYDIQIEYHPVQGLGKITKYRVVGVVVVPSSRKDSKIREDGSVDCGGEDGPPLTLSEDDQTGLENYFCRLVQ